MPTYLVNKRPQPTGEHEVHTTGCEHKPDPANQVELGFFNDCHGALREARKHFGNIDGCAFCCPDCHKS